MSQIFIYYSRKVQDEVARLSQELGDLGHIGWFDQKLAGGQAWWNEILTRIRDCDFFIVALAPETLESQATNLEWTYAAALDKPILPVLLADGVSSNLLPGVLTKIQYVDYRAADRQAAFALVNAISKLPPAGPLPETLPDAPEVPVSYLSSIKEQVESSGTLSFKDQTALVQRLEQGAANEEDLRDISAVLARFKKRDDLLATIDKRIDALVAKIEGNSIPAVRAMPRQPAPERAQSWDPPPALYSGDGVTGQPAATSPPPPAAAPSHAVAREPGRRYAEAKSPPVALILSLLIVGLGQFYNGDMKKGAVMLGGAVIGGAVTLGLVWIGMMIWSAIDAYQVAVQKSPLWN